MLAVNDISLAADANDVWAESYDDIPQLIEILGEMALLAVREPFVGSL
jgi:hypothetical protein